MPSLLTPFEVEEILRLPSGRPERLARKGKMKHVTLPDGSIRFRRRDIEELAGIDLGSDSENKLETVAG